MHPLLPCSRTGIGCVNLLWVPDSHLTLLICQGYGFYISTSALLMFKRPSLGVAFPLSLCVHLSTASLKCFVWDLVNTHFYTFELCVNCLLPPRGMAGLAACLLGVVPVPCEGVSACVRHESEPQSENENLAQIDCVNLDKTLGSLNARQLSVSIFKTGYNLGQNLRLQSFPFQVSRQQSF